MSFGIWAPTHPGDLDLHPSAWPSFFNLNSPLEVHETIQIPSNGSAPLRVDVQVFMTNVFNVVSVLRPRRGGTPVLSGQGWDHVPGVLCSPALLCHVAANPQVTCCPPQDILRYTVSSMLLLRLVRAPWGVGQSPL